jgi:transcriptional regulator with XRE-family HTH domain
MSIDHSALGTSLHDRRVELGLSLRAVAARAAISPAYLATIEQGRNPSTGRPPVPSVEVLSRLASALGVDVNALLRPASAPATPHHAHLLAYVTEPPPGGLPMALNEVLGADVDHWLYIADPRFDAPATTPRVTVRRFTLGRPPYATPDLDGDALVAAIDAEAAALARSYHGRRVGLVIADCSAVMRYLNDAAAEVALESRWHDAVVDIWMRRLAQPPAADVCVYEQSDLAALGVTIDQLAIALELITRHDRVLVFDGSRTISGAPAVRRILDQAQPAGTSGAAWGRLATAAAQALVG